MLAQAFSTVQMENRILGMPHDVRARLKIAQ